MTLFELIHDVKWDDIAASLRTHYELDEDAVESHFQAFMKIKTLNPTPTKMRICLMKVVEDYDGKPHEYPYWDISGKDGSRIKDSEDYENFKDSISEERANQEESYALEFRPWKEWLGMAIDSDTANNLDLSRADILAHVLYEMTFVGFDEIEVQSKKDNLDARLEEALALKDVKNGRVLDFQDVRKKLGIPKDSTNEN